jgi:hypothetical protein
VTAGPPAPGGRRRDRAVAAARRFRDLHHELFMAPWRAGVEREARRQRDLLVTLVFIEALGVENPAAFHTMELYPELLEAYHDWHRRQGLERAAVPGACC